jgi:DNA polymerase-3 subunit gamma/tau
VPATIKSRCLQFEFRRLSLHEMTDRLELIAKQEGLKIERAALEAVARQGTGSARDSISLLDQIVSDPEEEITLDDVQRILGTASGRAVKEVVESFIDQQVARGLHVINMAIDAGSDPRQFGQQLVEHLRAVLLAQTGSPDLIEASEEERALYQQQAEQITRSRLVAAIRAFNEAVNNYKGGWQPQLSLELALIESSRVPEEETLPAGIRQSTPALHGETALEPEQVEATPPGTAPVIPLSTVREQWDDMLKALYKIHKTAPDVVRFFQVQRVEGNQVVLSTDDKFMYKRLNAPEKLRIVEQALTNVHGVPLRVKLAPVGKVEGGGKSAVPVEDDPVLAAGLELGAEIRYDEDES